jgi:hypothetical protein
MEEVPASDPSKSCFHLRQQVKAGVRHRQMAAPIDLFSRAKSSLKNIPKKDPSLIVRTLCALFKFRHRKSAQGVRKDEKMVNGIWNLFDHRSDRRGNPR